MPKSRVRKTAKTKTQSEKSSKKALNNAPKQTLFEKNLSALLDRNTKLAAQILSVQENKKYEVFQGKDLVDINIVDSETGEVFYQNSIQSVIDRYDEIEGANALNPYLYFFGLGNGVLIKMLLGNQHHKRILILEPELEIIYVAFNLIDFSQELIDKRVMFVLAGEFTFPVADILMNYHDVRIYSKLFNLDIMIDYYLKYSQTILDCNAIFMKSIHHIITGHGNDSIDSLIGIEHHIKNTHIMLKNPRFIDFVKTKNTDLAVIASTGPSLAKQLPLLKEVAPYVTIISVDASLPILAQHNIKPDIVVSIERVELTARFFENTPEEFQEDIIFVCASLQHEKVLRNIKRGQKVLVMRPFRISKYFELDEFGYAGIGMSAANMAYEIAFMLGFDNTVLIGQDLAYAKDGKSHSSGHTFGENEIKHREDDEYIDAYGGDGLVKTTRIWKMFLNFFEKGIADTQKQMKTINATEGGARIHGSIERSFKEVCDEVDRSRVKPQITLIKPTQEEYDDYYKRAMDKIDKMLEVGEKTKAKVEEVFLKVADACKELETLNKENKLDDIDFDKLTVLLDDIDEVKAIFEDDLDFVNMYYYSIQSYIIHQELELAKVRITNPQDDLGKKVKMIDWIMKHKYWLFSLAGGISAQIDIIKRAVDTMITDVE